MTLLFAYFGEGNGTMQGMLGLVILAPLFSMVEGSYLLQLPPYFLQPAQESELDGL